METGDFHQIRVNSRKWWDRSSLGRPDGGGIILTPTDIVYCHENRNMPFPDVRWMDTILRHRPELIFESLVNEALRSPGNKVMWHDHFDFMHLEHANESNALRWNSNNHPDKNHPDGEVRWFHSRSKFEPKELLDWANTVLESKRIPEVLIVDDDLDVVSYRVREFDPTGCAQPPNHSHPKLIPISSESKFVPEMDNPLFPGYMNGYVVDNFQLGVEDNSNSRVFNDLITRGLFVRSGFKYGVRWRAYSKPDFSEHAPWLICQPDSTPENWISACQGSRLSSGVGKIMLIPIVDDHVRYLGLLRPPPDSRWNLKRR